MVFTIFPLIWFQTEVRLDPNQSENGKYNLISVWFNKILKGFLCVYTQNKMLFENTKEMSTYTQDEAIFMIICVQLLAATVRRNQSRRCI